ncbi:Ribonuclease 2 [Acorus gramineus]|uniref:Ribonuclease 2 n=1 Tax=Acorus gramineus TaxID=55184 RepID=A0AAV9ARN3_ACOGR|nr:Ribonuclease 2 [Acorus gramineus]
MLSKSSNRTWQTFIIDGLWPDYNDGTWPACCSRSDFDVKKVFDPTTISSLMPLLVKYWPSLSCSSASLCHGGKEKHGTCSSPSVIDEYDYFSKTLNLYMRYNVTKVLDDAGFRATNADKYPLGEIVSTITKAFGAPPSLSCSHGAVEELYLCFTKDFKPRDCANGLSTAQDPLNSRKSCPTYIRIPEYTQLVTISADAELSTK